MIRTSRTSQRLVAAGSSAAALAAAAVVGVGLVSPASAADVELEKSFDYTCQVTAGGLNLGDEAITDHIIRHAKTVYHPCGTCRMGTDEQAVVDPRLRVRGVPRLRIADASIMPRLTSGNTNAPAIMIGDRCADFILGTS